MLADYAPDIIWVIIWGCTGLILGSFFNVVIYRVPRGESVVSPPSHCPACQMPVKARDNIPVLSWFFLKGRCRFCKIPIRVEYPVVEALAGMVSAGLVLLYLKSSLSLDLSQFLSLYTLAMFTIPFVVMDYRYTILPNLLTYSGILIGLTLSFLPGGITVLQSLSGSVIASSGLWLLGYFTSRLLHKEAMGLGDVKLVAMTGALFGLPTALLGIIAGSFLGLLLYLPRKLIRKGSGSHEIPFGPYLCGGTLSIVLTGITPEIIIAALY